MSFLRQSVSSLLGSPVINVYLMGGLGNQMFQYAMAVALAERTGRTVNLDTRFLRMTEAEHTHREFALDAYDIHATIDAVSPMRINLMPKVRESESTPAQQLSKIPNGSIFLQGFWQSHDYFKDHRQLVSKHFSLAGKPSPRMEEFSKRVANEPHSVSIHVRRGDYVTNQAASGFHGTCPLTYYQQAIRELKAQFPVHCAFVFTDDVEWVTENFSIDLPFEVVAPDESRTPAEDIRMMAMCRHHVIANSSFSWWGAWLSEQNGSIVAPKRWFANEQANAEHIVPKHWIRL
jgi:Glycosyl transferase family 11